MSISELISKLAASDDQKVVEQLEGMFTESAFGLLMSGVPKGEPGQKLVVEDSKSMTMQFVNDPNGRRMIKACADPELFDIHYPNCINVTMNGRELLEMTEKIPEADGILICSATSFHSFPIYKATYQRVRKAKPINKSRKWWEFWKRA